MQTLVPLDAQANSLTSLTYHCMLRLPRLIDLGGSLLPADANTGAMGHPGKFLTYVCMLLLPRLIDRARSLFRDNSINAPVVLFPKSETTN